MLMTLMVAAAALTVPLLLLSPPSWWQLLSVPERLPGSRKQGAGSRDARCKAESLLLLLTAD